MPKAPTEEATSENVQAYNTHNDDNNFATYDACNISHEVEKLHEVLPKSFWRYALNTACHTLNRVPSKSVDKTPYELWKGKRPNLSYIKIWGCDAYLKRVESDKLEAKSDKYLFVGYPKETVGYYFYNPIEMKVIISKHVVFLDKRFILRRNSGSKVDLEEVQETTNKIDQLDVPMAELSSDEVQIEKVETTSSQGHTSSA
ncbi:Retrotransposon protein [Abeliophyllum distichum]|uniref:Retrotransposon protein n=1 Tax=Abeliophyllum distichum TaxID=126358 RepID=A0ABD1RRG4_9LAMI